MNGNNSNKPNKKSKLASEFVWLILLVLLIVGKVSRGIGGPVFVVIGFFAAVAVLVLSIARKKSTAARPSESESESSPAAPQSPMRPSAPAREYYDSDCMRASTGHDHDRRVEQLDAFLEDGLITKEEYAMMQERYEKQERNG